MSLGRRVGWVLAASVAAALSGCALEKPPTAEELRSLGPEHTALPAQFKAGGLPSAVADQWLATFDDPMLSPLVGEAIAHNYDYRVAAARAAQAAGYMRVASAALLPAVNALAHGGGKGGGDGSGVAGIWVNASLEIDVWGRLRYGRAAAEAQSVAAQADLIYARQSLAALVAKSWFVANEAGLQRRIALDVLQSSEELFRIAQERFRVGIAGEQDVADARAKIGTYRDTLRQLDLAREQAIRALELLLGRYPTAETEIPERLATVPAPVPVGLPSQLLERRPDVVAAERRVAAAFNRVGEAKAAQLPRISLSAGGSSVSSDLFVLQEHSNPVWSFGGNLLAPIYQGGALRAQVEIRTAEQDQAVAEYARTAQRAFGEIEGALSAERALRDRDLILASNVVDMERALQLSLVQYRVGTTDLRSVQQRELALFGARTSRLQVQGQLLAQRVNLYLALGGGFDAIPTGPIAERTQ